MKSITKNKMYLILIFSLILAFVLCQSSLVWAEAKKVVKIGFIDPLTGPTADIGIGAKNSAELAVLQANASGEFPYEIELVAEDDASDPATGVAAALKLCSDPDVVAVISHFNSAVALATVHTFHRFGVAQIMPSSIHPDITRGNDYKEVSRICADNIAEHNFGVDLVVDKLGNKNWSSIYDTSSYGDNCNNNFKKVLEERGGVLLSEDGISVGTKDFRPILNKIKELKPEGIYFGGLTTEAALCKRQMQELGMDDIVFFGVTGLDSETFNEIAESAAEGTIIVGKSALGEDSDFVKAYKAAGFNEPYEATGPYAYDAIGIILEALKKVGPDRKAIVDYIADPDFEYHGVIGLTKLDEDGQSITGGLALKVSRDGEWVPWSE
ncbi:MAG TPA: branched-chain amino acid ABC transporter substrate-binding protein [Atribacterota bacterium]|nr:branched-chain amino acid ABC transporter substrate-binding protein [Atribacterota bacterium]